MLQRPSEDNEAILDRLFGGACPTRWVTRERPKNGRIACPWSIRRFLDERAEILYVPTERVFDVALREHAVPFDIPAAPYTHDGDDCSFDAFIKAFSLRDPAPDTLALIVRGADTDSHELAPEAAGLLAVSLGLSLNFADDHELLARGFSCVRCALRLGQAVPRRAS